MNQGLLFDDNSPVEYLDTPGGDVTLFRSFLNKEETDDYVLRLQSGNEVIAWEQDFIKMYGKEIPLPRHTAWYGDPGMTYTYSGIRMTPLSWTGVLAELRDRISGHVGESFNSLLCNLYRDGNDCVAWHSDDEPELGTEPVIASLTFGGTRTFQMRLRDDPTKKQEVELRDGDLLVMRGHTQSLWQHQLPRTKNKNRQAQRINLTFRWVSAT
jgi:alkylated DNA repair dioxygenase AlkB